MYAEAKHSFKKHGVMVEGVSVDVAAMQKQKAGAVDGLTKGIEGLFKKNKVGATWLPGWLAGAGWLDRSVHGVTTANQPVNLGAVLWSAAD